MAFPARQKQLFYLELAKLVHAGFGIREAAEVMRNTKPPAEQAAVLQSLQEGLAAGRSIGDSFSGNATITDLERSIVGAGERGGKLAPAFQHLAEYFGMLASVRRDIVAGLIYPLVLLHLGVVLAVVPSALMRGEASFDSILLKLGLAFLGLYAAAFLLFLLFRALFKAAPGNVAVDRALNRIPFLGKTRRSLAMARFTKVYHTSLLAGLPMHETARTAADATHGAVLRRAGLLVAEAAKTGNPLGPVFMAEPAFPNAFARSYATAEESGMLDKDLERWSTVFQDDARAAAKALSVAVPKIVYALIVIFIAWKILSFFSDHYGMLEELSE